MRQNNNRLQVAAIIIVFVAGALIFTTSSTYNIANAQGAQQQKSVVRDSQTILFRRQNYSPNDYIHLYDSTPYMILNGHIVAKLPCEAHSRY